MPVGNNICFCAVYVFFNKIWAWLNNPNIQSNLKFSRQIYQNVNRSMAVTEAPVACNISCAMSKVLYS